MPKTFKHLREVSKKFGQKQLQKLWDRNGAILYEGKNNGAAIIQDSRGNFHFANAATAAAGIPLWKPPNPSEAAAKKNDAGTVTPAGTTQPAATSTGAKPPATTPAATTSTTGTGTRAPIIQSPNADMSPMEAADQRRSMLLAQEDARIRGANATNKALNTAAKNQAMRQAAAAIDRQMMFGQRPKPAGFFNTQAGVGKTSQGDIAQRMAAADAGLFADPQAAKTQDQLTFANKVNQAVNTREPLRPSLPSMQSQLSRFKNNMIEAGAGFDYDARRKGGLISAPIGQVSDFDTSQLFDIPSGKVVFPKAKTNRRNTSVANPNAQLGMGNLAEIDRWASRFLGNTDVLPEDQMVDNSWGGTGWGGYYPRRWGYGGGGGGGRGGYQNWYNALLNWSI